MRGPEFRSQGGTPAAPMRLSETWHSRGSMGSRKHQTERDWRTMMNMMHNPSKATGADRSRSQHRVIQRIAISFSTLALQLFVGCGGNSTASAPTASATPTDYSQAQNWANLPNASQGVDVLFF